MRRFSLSSLSSIIAILAITTFIASCGDDAPTGSGDAPVILEARVEPNVHNVLSAIVVVRASGAETVTVEYRHDGDTAYRFSVPAQPVRGDSAVVGIVALHPERSYRIRVTARGAGGAETSIDSLFFTAGAIPADMPGFTVTKGSNPAPGYVMLGFTAGDTALGGFYAVIVDNDGTPVWYRKFATQVTDFQRQPNGNFTAFGSLASEPRRFYEFDRLGNIVREYAASGGLETGAHELRLTSDGYLLWGVKDSVMDLTSLGGRVDAKVKGMFVEYHRAGGSVFRWSTFDHLAIDEALPDVPLHAASVNPWHINAIDIDTDGNLLASLRNSGMIIKIDVTSGEILWRLGGEKSDFTFIGDPLDGFTHQHGIRRLPNGNIILFDNGNLHQPPTSRAVEYRLDETGKRAEMVWEYRGHPSFYSFALGFAHRAPNGNTLICYGTARHLIEVDAAGTEQWHLVIDLDELGYFIYRAFRIGSVQ